MKTNLKDYIKVFNKFYSKKQCQLIINSLDTSKTIPHTFYNVITNTQEDKGRDPKVSFLKEEKVEQVGSLIKDQWFKVVTEYILKWLNREEKIDWFKGWSGYTFPKFVEYNKGTTMTNHCDHIYSIFSQTGEARGVPILSMITVLNDDYAGGEILMCDKYKYKLKTGETIVFPSNFLYPHSIKKITKGTRHSMVSWVY